MCITVQQEEHASEDAGNHKFRLRKKHYMATRREAKDSARLMIPLQEIFDLWFFLSKRDYLYP
jgi:hypothetical protein